MRVAFISYEFPPDTLGGIATYARHTVRLLAERGHDVTVFSGRRDGSHAPRVESFGSARVLRLPCADRREFHRPAIASLTAEHTLHPFDVAEVPDLYAEGWGLRAAAPDLPFILRAHTPLYIPREIDFLALPPWGRRLSALRRLLGGLSQRSPLRQTWSEARARMDFFRTYHPQTDPERQIALEADLVVPPSRHLADRLLRDWHLSSDHVHVLPYAHFPAPHLLALSPPAQARVIGFHGSVRRFKGVHVLAAAMPLVLQRHPDVRFVLAGASATSPVPNRTFAAWRADRMVEWRDTAEWLRPHFDALGSGRVTLSGFVHPENLAVHLAATDLCVFPSLFDNFPSACLEAMSAARPIVATSSGGMAEMLDGGTAGALVPPGDAPALAAGLCRLLENPALRLAFATRARERVATLCAPAVIAPQHEALFAVAIERRRASRPIAAPSHA